MADTGGAETDCEVVGRLCGLLVSQHTHFESLSLLSTKHSGQDHLLLDLNNSDNEHLSLSVAATICGAAAAVWGDNAPVVLGGEFFDLPKKSIMLPCFSSFDGAKPPNPEPPALDGDGGSAFLTAAFRLKPIAKEVLLDDTVGPISIEADTVEEVTRSTAIGDRKWKFFGCELAVEPTLLRAFIGKLKVKVDVLCDPILTSDTELLPDPAVEHDDIMVTNGFRLVNGSLIVDNSDNSTSGSISSSSSPGEMAT